MAKYRLPSGEVIEEGGVGLNPELIKDAVLVPDTTTLGVPAPIAPQPAQPTPQPVPQPAPAPVQAPPVQPALQAPTLHTVNPGDTLSQIAQRFGVSTAQITGYRSGNPNLIFPGEVLTINKLEPQAVPEKPVPEKSASKEPAPAEPQVPVPAPTPSPEPPPAFDFDALFKQYGLSTNNTIEDVVKTVSKLYGFEGINAEMKTLDDEFIDASADIRDNPWLTSGIQDAKIAKLKERYDLKKDALVNRLRLQNDVVGKAVDLFYKEREYKKDIVFKAIEMRQKEIEAQVAASKEEERIRQFETREDRAERGEERAEASGELAARRLDLAEEANARAERAEALRMAEYNSGALTPKQNSIAIQLTNSLKSNAAYTDMLDVATGLDGTRVGLSQKTGFGDITAINSFQRMIDPGATVRSEDVVLLQSASGLFDKISVDYPLAKLKQGNKLPQAVREGHGG